METQENTTITTQSETKKRKLKIPSEVIYLLSIVLMALSVSMLTQVDFGISMIIAPAYLVSLKVSFLTFGLAEYVVQAGILIIFFFVIRRFRPIYLTAFITCIIYGAVLDLFRLVIPPLNPDITPVGSFPLAVNIVLFILGMCLTSFSVALSFKTYLYPQVYDLFVKGVTERYNLKVGMFKTAFDFLFLMVSIALSFLFFGRLEGIRIGTLIMAVLNGTLISYSGKFIDRFFEIKPIFKKLYDYFERY